MHKLIENVHNLKGIVIGAHVNSNSGLRKIFLEYEAERLSTIREIQKLESQSSRTSAETAKLKELQKEHAKITDDVQNRYLKFLGTHSIDAVQINRSGEEQFYAQHHVALLGLNPFPCLLCSDAHNSADIGAVDNRTFIKLQAPTIEGLLSAFKDPGARLRYDTDEILSKTAYIEGIEVTGGFLDGATASFSENLSCLIGGRGSGKSTIIESLRFLFGADVPQEVKAGVKKMHDFVLKNAKIKVLFKTKDGERFALKCSRATNGDPVFECWDIAGNLCPEVKQWSDKLHIDLYGWSEIEKLSYDMTNQRGLIDSAIPEAEDMKKSIDEMISVLRVNRADIMTWVHEYNSLVPKVTGLTEAQEAKKRILAELKPQLKTDQDKLISKNEKEVEKLTQQLDALAEVMEDYRNDLESLEEIEIGTISKSVLDRFTPVIQKKLHDSLDAGKESHKLTQKHLEKIIATLQQEHDALSKKVTKLHEKLEQLQNDPAYKACLGLLKSKSTVDAEIRKYHASEQRMKKVKKELDKDLTKRKGLEKELTGKQKSLYEKRVAVVTKINSDLVKVNEKLEERNVRLEIGIEELADKTKLTEYLTLAMKNIGNWYKVQQHPMAIAEAFSPSELVETLWEGHDLEIVSRTSLSAEQAKKVVEHFGFEMADGTWHEEYVERVLEISEQMHQDKPSIKYNGKSLTDGLSPGQRCTALLPLIFLRTTLTPLIIDQPEDNLDSQLVFELVVDMLRGLKERRQVIIATHNPNIPVSGDAEQVIVLSAVSDKKTEIVHQGSIDDPQITEKIKTLLEGGEEAFKIRSRKYGLLK